MAEKNSPLPQAEKTPPLPSTAKKSTSLSKNQKIALAGAAAIIAIVLGAYALTLPQPQNTQISAAEFSKLAYYAPSAGIFMDLRGTQDAALRQKIQQCGVNLAGSGLLARKELAIASCDDASCVLTLPGANSTLDKKPYDVLKELSRSLYFHINGGSNEKSVFFKNRVEVMLSPSSNFSCQINLLEEPIQN